MTPEEHRSLRESLADRAIGRLSGDEAAALDAHLDGCPGCRAELREISSVLGPLDGVEPDRLDDVPAPPADLGDRIVAAARAGGTPPRRSARWIPVAAASVVAAVVGAGVGYGVGDHDGIPREPVAVQALDPAVQASATAIPHTWGVEIVLDGDGFRSGATYRVFVDGDDGRRAAAGEFIGTGESPMVCNLNSSMLRSDATSFTVVDVSGGSVLRGDLST